MWLMPPVKAAMFVLAVTLLVALAVVATSRLRKTGHWRDASTSTRQAGCRRSLSSPSRRSAPINGSPWKAKRDERN